MKTTGVQNGVASFVTAVVLLLQISPALASAPQVGRTAQGSLVPGTPVASTEAEKNKDQGLVRITFTKWRTAQIPPPPAVTVRTLFAGFVGGDLGAGDFIGEVLDRKVSTPCTTFDPLCPPGLTPATITIPIVALHAIYEVQAGSRSFIALIQGGTNGATGAALLDGVILAGWRTGAKVHVAFQTTTNCSGAPSGTCFQGTITISPDFGG